MDRLPVRHGDGGGGACRRLLGCHASGQQSGRFRSFHHGFPRARGVEVPRWSSLVLQHERVSSEDESLYDPTRYPMSRLTDMVTNVGLQWIPLVYAAALLLPSSVERGCAVRHPAVRHGAVRPYGGGVATYLWYRDKGKKTIYHTGLATSLMMFLPAAAYLIAHIAGVTATDWLWCLVLFAVMCCVCVPLTETPLKKWVRQAGAGHVRVRRCQVLHALRRLLQGGCRAV